MRLSTHQKTSHGYSYLVFASLPHRSAFARNFSDVFGDPLSQISSLLKSRLMSTRHTPQNPLVMSRRRGVVVSDDEETPPATSSRQSRGRVISSRRPAETEESSSSRGKKVPVDKDVPENILNLPSVSNYNPQEIQSLLAFKDDSKKL